MTNLEKNSKTSKPAAETGVSAYLGQAIDALLNLDIPAKGRIAHHIRTGRLQRALALCGKGRYLLWQKVWERNAPAMLDQVRLLGQVEALLHSAMTNGKMETVGGSY